MTTNTHHETIYTRASENLEALRNQHAAITAQLDQAQTDHQSAAIAAQHSTEQYQASLPRLQSLEHAWRVANHYAMLAEDVDPDGETKRSADQLAEQVKVASAERDQLLRKANADSAHEQQLTAQIARLQGELTTIADQLAQGKGVHDTAHAALGIARHSEALAVYSERQSRIDALKAELSKLEAERDQDLDERSKGLRDWNDHHRFVRALRQPEDSALKVIKAELAYIQSLIIDLRIEN